MKTIGNKTLTASKKKKSYSSGLKVSRRITWMSLRRGTMKVRMYHQILGSAGTFLGRIGIKSQNQAHK